MNEISSNITNNTIPDTHYWPIELKPKTETYNKLILIKNIITKWQSENPDRYTKYYEIMLSKKLNKYTAQDIARKQTTRDREEFILKSLCEYYSQFISIKYDKPLKMSKKNEKNLKWRWPSKERNFYKHMNKMDKYDDSTYLEYYALWFIWLENDDIRRNKLNNLIDTLIKEMDVQIIETSWNSFSKDIQNAIIKKREQVHLDYDRDSRIAQLNKLSRLNASYTEASEYFSTGTASITRDPNMNEEQWREAKQLHLESFGPKGW